MENLVRTLTSLPATDGNFLSALSRASKENLVEAIKIMENSNGMHKSRIAACKKELNKKSDISFMFKKAEKIENISDKMGEQFYDFFVADGRNTSEIGKNIIKTLKKCKTKTEFNLVNDMLVATCGFSFETILNEIKVRDNDKYNHWENGKVMNIRQVVKGEYVATPIKNAYNDKISYWFSKDGCILALYMFTVGNGDTEKDFEERLSEKGFEEMIPRFEEFCKRPFNYDNYLEEKKKLGIN